MFNKKSFVPYLAAALASVCVTGVVHAQGASAKPLTILVGTGPGGNPDTIARVFQAYLAKQNLKAIVENRTGAGGAIALRGLFQVPADGYTIMSGASATHGLFVKEAGYNFEELIPVSIVGVSTYGLLTGQATGFKTIQEFVSYSKANPGKINIGVIPGTSHEIAADDLLSLMGVQGVKVPYKGMPDIYRALIAGELHASVHSHSPQVKSGQVRALAFGGTARLADAANVPTFRESGYEYDPGVGFVFYARIGTPRDRLLAINQQVAEMVKTTDFMNQVTKGLGITGLGLSLDESNKFSRSEYARVKAGVQRLGIKPQ